MDTLYKTSVIRNQSKNNGCQSDDGKFPGAVVADRRMTTTGCRESGRETENPPARSRKTTKRRTKTRKRRSRKTTGRKTQAGKIKG